MSNEKRKAILELFESGVSGNLDQASRRRLNELLAGDAEAQAVYIDQCQIHAMLAWEHGTLSPQPFRLWDPAARSSTARRAMVRSLWLWRWLAISASILFLVSTSLAVYIGKSNPTRRFAATANTASLAENALEAAADSAPVIPWESREVVAKLTRYFGAQLTTGDADVQFAAQRDLRQGRYQLWSGLIEVAFANDVQVVVESPAEFEILSSMRMAIHDGRMSAKVPEQGKGFEVETPSGNLVDYGTEFSVEVLPDSDVEYHVFQGEVKIRPKNGLPATKDLTLTTGQAASIHAESGVPEGIDIDHNRFVRRLDPSGDAQSKYERFVNALRPTTWLRMSPSSDGETLKDAGTSPTDATIIVGAADASLFTPGVSGASLLLGGPVDRSHAKVCDYQPATNGRLSLCAWVLAESRPRWASIAKHWAIEWTDDQHHTYEGLGGQFHFGLQLDDGDLELQVLDAADNMVKLREGVVFPIGQWQHVAFVANGKMLRLYRNGKVVAATPCAGLGVRGPRSMGIGVKLGPDGKEPDTTNPGYWHGRIDELTIFDRALRPIQIARLYKSGERTRKVARAASMLSP